MAFAYSKTLYFLKLSAINIAIFMISGFDLTLYMPSLESFLNCEELKTAGLTENPTFQFLLRAGYEQILRTQSDMDVEI